MASSKQPTPRVRTVDPTLRASQRKRPTFASGILPLVVVCSLLLSAGMAFGNPFIWRTLEQQAADAAADQSSDNTDGTLIEGADDKSSSEVRGSYTATTKSEDEGHLENIRLSAEAINGVVIQPGDEFSFDSTVGDIAAKSGYQESSGGNGGASQGDGSGVGQVSTALYIAAAKADLEITERHPQSVPTDYAPIGLEATIVHGTFDLRIKNNTRSPITIQAKAQGPSVEVTLLGEALPDGLTVDATSQVVQQYHRADGPSGQDQQYYVTESFRVYRQDGERSTRDLLSRDVYLVEDGDAVVLAEENDNSPQE